MKNRLTSLLLVIWQPFSPPTVGGQIVTTAADTPSPSSRSVAIITGSCVPASFVALILLILSAALVVCYFRKRKLRNRYNVDNYIADAPTDHETSVDTHSVYLISYKNIQESPETRVDQERNEADTVNQISAHPHGTHSYDLLACNV